MATKKYKIISVSFNTPTIEKGVSRLLYKVGGYAGGSFVQSIELVSKDTVRIIFEDGDFLISNIPHIIQYSNR